LNATAGTGSAGRDAGLARDITREHPDFNTAVLDHAAWGRLERLALASPLYRSVLLRRPRVCLWLEQPRNRDVAYRYQALSDEWNTFSAAEGAAAGDDEEELACLRRWRRLMSVRIAYRSVNALAGEEETTGELTRLAEFCLRRCVGIATARWKARLGEPRDGRSGEPARFCVLALGKLGGGELNFSSDIDLIYCHEGDGALELFTKVAETVTGMLSARTQDGFLFRVDVRLRPEGAWGPLVQPVSSMEYHYATAGQTWERMALVKARPVAGDLALGAELLEDLHPFRYPRRPPPSLLAEVAAMQSRSERELVGVEALDRDVKHGPGGIREIEFMVQSLQLLHAGRFPFFQTPSTAAALEQLVRYELMGPDDARFLGEAYWFLRKVEHRLQIREEGQTHELPADPALLAELATSLGFTGAGEFRAELDRRRQRVHALYAALFADREVDLEFEAWCEFFTTERTPSPVARRLDAWFGPGEAAAPALRLFVCGSHRPQVTRELVTRFQHLCAGFDVLVPQLAQPLVTLARLARCAERYGTRQQFLNACASNPHLLRALLLICDRSAYGAELLAAHPEILEEVLRPEMLRRRKSAADLRRELAEGPGDADWLWLYARAEQMRAVIGELLGFLGVDEVEASLTALADAVLGRLFDGAGVLVVALGKYGGSELSFGSDLDLLFVSEEGAEEQAGAAVRAARHLLQRGRPLGPLFAVDLRLRPHGDAGPLVTTIRALEAYHSRAPGGTAQAWERQMLVRARVVCGPAPLARSFEAWTASILYARSLPQPERDELWRMRMRIERERDAGPPEGRSFKNGAGGLLDCEFLAQALQLEHGHRLPGLRVTGTRAALDALAATGIVPPGAAATLAANFAFLRRVEFALRRDSATAASTLPAEPAGRLLLARWLGYPDEESFMAEHLARMRGTRQLLLELAGPAAGVLRLETRGIA
jgi:[glutamine synthetase] adenylyltransferase / [glutamine synthetase]-adenylyl-L-tyrosine phosphorylase